MGNIMNQDDFKKVETLIIDDGVWVAGKLKKKDDEVSVSGNDKVQLLASGKAHIKKKKENSKS